VAKTGGNVIDLMAALKASLEAKSSKAAVKERKAPKKAPGDKPRKTASH
jgi:non-homologous end joining protein Ku